MLSPYALCFVACSSERAILKCAYAPQGVSKDRGVEDNIVNKVSLSSAASSSSLGPQPPVAYACASTKAKPFRAAARYLSSPVATHAWNAELSAFTWL